MSEETEGATPEVETPAVETPAVETPAVPEGVVLNDTEKAALAKAREGMDTNVPTPKSSEPQRPEGVPEKFWKDGKVDVEAMTASYAALEAKLGQPKPAAETPAEETPAADGTPEGTVDANGKIVKPAAEEAASEEAEANPLVALMDTARSDYAESNTFSEETSEALVKAGIPKEIQDVYQAGLAALGAQLTATVQGYTGGEENYNKMAAWAGRTLDDAELDAFNAALDNPALAQNAVVGLYSRYQAANKSEGKQVAPVNAASDAGDTFKSREEFKAAVADPRYATDPVYRRSVEEKLSRTRLPK